jgi:hypothetical protein
VGQLSQDDVNKDLLIVDEYKRVGQLWLSQNVSQQLHNRIDGAMQKTRVSQNRVLGT